MKRRNTFCCILHQEYSEKDNKCHTSQEAHGHFGSCGLEAQQDDENFYDLLLCKHALQVPGGQPVDKNSRKDLVNTTAIRTVIVLLTIYNQFH